MIYLNAACTATVSPTLLRSSVVTEKCKAKVEGASAMAVVNGFGNKRSGDCDGRVAAFAFTFRAEILAPFLACFTHHTIPDPIIGSFAP